MKKLMSDKNKVFVRRGKEKKSPLLVKIKDKCLFVVLDAPANMSGKEDFKMLRTSQKARS